MSTRPILERPFIYDRTANVLDLTTSRFALMNRGRCSAGEVYIRACSSWPPLLLARRTEFSLGHQRAYFLSNSVNDLEQCDDVRLEVDGISRVNDTWLEFKTIAQKTPKIFLRSVNDTWTFESGVDTHPPCQVVINTTV